ncbi:MAG: ATP-grasp domain-containing protein [Hyphomicrobiales bacterium]|nr:ATP-grasp domain-containing protein [Hyphomicrobiales bacterium]
MKRVLVYEFLSAGGVAADDPHEQATLLAQGAAMRNAIAADLARSGRAIELCVAVSDAAPASIGAPQRAQADEQPLDFFRRAIGQVDQVWAVAPESGGMLLQLARIAGPDRWIGCNEAAITLTASKTRTLAALERAGVATPRGFAGPRYVVKPEDGAGCAQTFVYDTHALAQAAAVERCARGEAVAIEPFVEGEALSLSLLCGQEGVELLSVNRQHIETSHCGALAFRGVSADATADPRGPVLAAFAREIVAAIPGLAGFVGVDLVWSAAQGPTVIEVNPRATSAYVGLSRRLGRNIGDSVLSMFAP